MKKWDKVTITWDPHHEWETNIVIDDMESCPLHIIKCMKAVSALMNHERDRIAILTFDIFRGYIGPTTKKEEIAEKLRTFSEDDKYCCVRFKEPECGSDYKISFHPRNEFIEDVLAFVEDLIKLFGVKDDGIRYHFSSFDIKRETLVKEGDGWIPFTNWIKIRKRLFVEEIGIQLMPEQC